MSAVEKFPILLSDAEEESSAVPPCFSHEGINVCFSELSRVACCVFWPSRLAPRLRSPQPVSPIFQPDLF